MIKRCEALTALLRHLHCCVTFGVLANYCVIIVEIFSTTINQNMSKYVPIGMWDLSARLLALHGLNSHLASTRFIK